MTVQTYEQRILIPEECHFLVNHTAKTISDKVYLGINADAAEWIEITADEAEVIQAQWDEDANTEIVE